MATAITIILFLIGCYLLIVGLSYFVCYLIDMAQPLHPNFRRFGGPVLSIPSAEILKTFNKIPKDRRPSIDIVNVLRRLDEKYGESSIGSHFGVPYRRTTCSCYRNCPMPEYNSLNGDVSALLYEVEKQQETLRLNGFEDVSDRVKNIRQILYDEVEITRKITKEFLN